MSKEKITIKMLARNGDDAKIKTVNKKSGESLIRQRQAVLVKDINTKLDNINEEFNKYDLGIMRKVMSGFGRERR